MREAMRCPKCAIAREVFHLITNPPSRVYCRQPPARPAISRPAPANVANHSGV